MNPKSNQPEQTLHFSIVLDLCDDTSNDIRTIIENSAVRQQILTKFLPYTIIIRINKKTKAKSKEKPSLNAFFCYLRYSSMFISETVEARNVCMYVIV